MANAQPNDTTLFPILEGELYGYINRKGEVVLPPQFHYAGHFYNHMAVARKDKGYGYINTKGEFVIPPVYDITNDFIDNIVQVCQNRKWHYIDVRGNKVKDNDTSCTTLSISDWERCIMYNSEYDFVDTLGGWTVIRSKKTGRQLLRYFQEIDWLGFQNGLLLARQDNRLVYIDTLWQTVWQQKQPLAPEFSPLNIDFKPILESSVPKLTDGQLKKTPISADSLTHFSLSILPDSSFTAKGINTLQVALEYFSAYSEDTFHFYEPYVQFKLWVKVDDDWDNLISNRTGRKKVTIFADNPKNYHFRLPPQHSLVFDLPIFQGATKGQCKYTIDIDGKTVSTQSFDCQYNYAQLINRHTSSRTRFIDTALGRSKHWPIPSYVLRCGTLDQFCKGD